jgi:subtilisin family serine protease
MENLPTAQQIQPKPRNSLRLLVFAIVGSLSILGLIPPVKAADNLAPIEYVDSLVVKYIPGAPATDTSGQPNGNDFVDTEISLELGQDLGFGYRTINFEQPIPTMEAQLIATQIDDSSAITLAEPNYTFSINQDVSLVPATASTLTQTLGGNFNWGLDRIDQASLPLNNSYTYPQYSATPTVYIVDSGIRASHAEFQTNGSSRVLSGYSAFEGQSPDDCVGHGTHVAGIVGGNTTGVLKNVNLVPVKVLDCNGTGSSSTLVNGINWIIANHNGGTAIANFSLGTNTRTGKIKAVDDAMAALIADGVQPVVASGNKSDDACFYSPANSADVIAVNALKNSDTRAEFSNFGSCTDLYAPGQSIYSAYPKSASNNFGDNYYATMSGTSMAAPFVAGVAANLLLDQPTLNPSQLRIALLTFTNSVVSTDQVNDPKLLIYQPQAGFTAPVNSAPGNKTPDAVEESASSTPDLVVNPVPEVEVTPPAPAPAPAPVAAPAPAPAAAPAAPAAPSGSVSVAIRKRILTVNVSAPAGSTAAIQVQQNKRQRVAYKRGSRTLYRTTTVKVWRTVNNIPTTNTSVRVRRAGIYRILINTPSGPIEGSSFRVR